jgi:hypothetical protein
LLKSSGYRDEGLDRLLADPALTSTAKAVAVALVKFWAWGTKDHCWPSDATIAARVGRSAGHVQRCLRELERAGFIVRERTALVRNGRRIWLTWRVDGQVATPGQAPAPRPEGPEAPRLPFAQAPEDLAPSAPARSGPPAPARSEEVVIVKPPKESGEQPPGRLRPEPPPAALPRRRPRGLGLNLAELAAVAGATGDRILARELGRLAGPATPPEPRAQDLPTAELLGLLPGRHDLVMAAARRLCVEAQDTALATLRTAEGMCRAVAAREVPAAVLAACLAQATGPAARHRGKVLVAAWKREAGGVLNGRPGEADRRVRELGARPRARP